MSEHPSCDTVREAAPDLALGLLTGEERAAALAHLERCEGCRAEVASLAVTADEVLLAAPEVEPPVGFGDRVLARLAAERAAGGGLPATSGGPARAVGSGRGGSRPVRRWRVAAALVAAAALAVAGLVAVVRSGAPDDEVAVAQMRTGTGAVVGDATAAGAETSVVTLDVPAWESMVEHWGEAPAATYWLVVEQEDGTRTMSALAADVDDWSMRVDAPVDEIATVSMLDNAGRVWCTGRFDT